MKTLDHLFDQLGLDSSDAGVEQFVSEHRPLAAEIELADAQWWSAGQAAFLREAIASDAAWAVPVDQLDALLRET